MPRIPEETIQEILAAIDIVDVVGGYIPLKRAGTAYKALCPFHTEKTPSFTVNPARNTFHCFGCGAGGTAIRFVMDYENLPFGEAVRKLADRAGVTIREEEYSAEEESKRALRSRLIQAHQAAAEWFHDLLLNSPAAKGARDYLRGRGIGGEIARRWMIGYAPDDTDLYREWAESNGYSPKLLVAGGLLALRDENNPSRGTYPKFRDRVMFPVKNDYGDYIAFSGRALRPDVPAKYMNSPESPIFNKSKTFFGLDRTKRAILKARCAIICEGQIDLVMCVEAGVENMVAPLGTAFTPDHARILKRHTDEVVLCYDSDTAGQAAVEKAYALLAKAGISVRVAEIPEGEDPDSFLRAHGAEAFRALVENAREFFDYLIAAGARKADLTSIAAKTQFSQKLAEHAAVIGDKIAQDAVVNQVAVRLAISPEEFRRRMAEAARQERFRDQRAGQREAKEAGEAGGNGAPPPIQIRDEAVLVLCRLLLVDADARRWIRAHGDRDLLRDVPEGALLAKLWDADFDPGQPVSLNSYLASLPPAEESFLSDLANRRKPGEGARDAERALFRLDVRRAENQLRATEAQLRDPSLSSAARLELLQNAMLRRKELLDRQNQLKNIERT